MIAWVALDRREVKQVQRQLEAPGSQGTVDELGLGFITDVIAEVLFPAFTTLMTRARYFAFARGVLDLAAELAWDKVKKSVRQDRDHADNEKLRDAFAANAAKLRGEIEMSLCLALALASERRGEDLDEEENEERVIGIIGIRRVKKKLRKGGLPRTALFDTPSRLPTSLYFTGIRKLGAFAESSGIRDLDDLWGSYFDKFSGVADRQIWDAHWIENTRAAAKVVRTVHLSAIDAEHARREAQWDAFDYEVASLELEPDEARLIGDRLGMVGNENAQTIRRVVAQTFLAMADEPETSAKGYDVLARACDKDAVGKAAFCAARDAMIAISPALTLYRNLSRHLLPTLRGRRAEDEALKLLSSLDLDSALAALGRLHKWKVPDGWKKNARLAITWLDGWLKLAVKAQSRDAKLKVIRELIRRENAIVKGRRKMPRLTADPLALTKERGVKDLKGKSEAYDEENPPEARSPSGRLHRAVRIYRDIRERYPAPPQRRPKLKRVG